MAIATEPSLIDQLYRIEGKAEIVNGRIVRLPLHVGKVAVAVANIVFSLCRHVKRAGLKGFVTTSTLGFIVDLPNRQSFCADAGYYEGPDSGMNFCKGPPLFAVEICGPDDYGPAVDDERADKRRDYFAPGTLAVWDLDLIGGEVIVRKYSADAPSSPVNFSRGEIADAEPAVPGWTMTIDVLCE